VESSPTSALVMAKAQFLLELAIIPFDPPPQLGRGNEIAQDCRFRQCGKPVFERLLVTFGPFDEEPFLVARMPEIVISRSDAKTNSGKARREIDIAALAPRDGLPRVSRQTFRKRLG